MLVCRKGPKVEEKNWGFAGKRNARRKSVVLLCTRMWLGPRTSSYLWTWVTQLAVKVIYYGDARVVEEHQSVRLRLPPLWRVVTRQWQFCVYFRSTFLVHFCFFFLTCLNLLRASVFHFERLDVLRDSIRHPSKKLLSFEFAQSFNIQFRASQYVTGLNQTSEKKVIVVWISSQL